MHTSKAQNERKRKFLMDHRQLARVILGIDYPFNYKLHNTPNGRLFVRLARECLGYSSRTWDADIIQSMRREYELLQECLNTKKA